MGVTEYFTATSLDGYIADADNSLQWLFDLPEGRGGHEKRWDHFWGNVGAMTMGATTYEWVLDHEDLLAEPQKWHDFYQDVPCWVFTHRDLPPIPGADIRFVRGEVAPVHAEMCKAARDQDIWVVGGGELVGAFHDAGLLDRLLLGLCPLTLGSGSPLLPRRVDLTLTEVVDDGVRVFLSYDVGR